MPSEETILVTTSSLSEFPSGDTLSFIEILPPGIRLKEPTSIKNSYPNESPSAYPSSVSTTLTTDIPSKGPIWVPIYDHSDPTMDINSILIY